METPAGSPAIRKPSYLRSSVAFTAIRDGFPSTRGRQPAFWRRSTGTLLALIAGMRAAVLFATREGQTRRIASRIADDLRDRGVQADLIDVADGAGIDFSGYDTACVAASVHVGHHEREMIGFVRKHRDELVRLGAAFVSVTLSEAGAEDPKRTEQERRQSAADVQRMLDVFYAETGWHPDRVLPVAGALAYSKYNFIVRAIMRRIARKAGAPTDTSSDYEFTNWVAVDRLAGELAKSCQ
jgi:menaquinone-dependent protoporphyrinogen oxidase